MNKFYTKQSKRTEDLGYASLETGISSPYTLLQGHTATLNSLLSPITPSIQSRLFYHNAFHLPHCPRLRWPFHGHQDCMITF